MDYKKIKKIAGISSLSLIAGFIAMTVYHYNAYLKAEKTWQQKVEELAAVREEVRQIERMIADYEKDKAAFENLLFSERDIPAFLDEISSFAKTDHVNIVDIQTRRFYQVPVPEEAAKQSAISAGVQRRVEDAAERERRKNTVLTLSAMPIDVKLEGAFADLASFLGRVQDYKQLTNISEVEISLTGDYPKLSCHFTLSIYSLKTLEELKIK